MFLLLVIVGIAELNDRSSSQQSGNNISDYKDSDYSENVADTAPSLEEEKQTLENQYSEEDVKSFLRSVYQQLKYDQSSHSRLFSNDGWERFYHTMITLPRENWKPLILPMLNICQGMKLKQR